MDPKREELALVLNLPPEVLIDILLLLPIKTIVSCKCVCKKWLDLISTSEFAKLHLCASKPCLIVSIRMRNGDMCSVFQIEDNYLELEPVMEINPNKLSSSPGANIYTMCSVNGLICSHEFSNEMNVIYISNPLTHEYIILPPLPLSKYERAWVPPLYYYSVKYGIGISRVSGQYKMVRITHQPKIIGCIVYTLGTPSWRKIEPNEVYQYDSYHSIGAFLGGNLHWLVGDAHRSLQISCFDLETELFKPLRPPFPMSFPQNATLTIVDNCLCFCNYTSDRKILEFWKMEEYGVKESWVRYFALCMNFKPFDYPCSYAVEELIYYVFKDFGEGNFLILKGGSCLFYERMAMDFKSVIDFVERDQCRWIRVLPYTPSFVSLRSLGVDNVMSF